MSGQSVLTAADREALLVPCSCGHTINDHGELAGCWACGDDGGDCMVTFEALLTDRLDAIVARHVTAALNEAADAIDAREVIYRDHYASDGHPLTFGRAEEARAAAAIVRTRTPTPPPSEADGPRAPGG